MNLFRTLKHYTNNNVILKRYRHSVVRLLQRSTSTILLPCFNRYNHSTNHHHQHQHQQHPPNICLCIIIILVIICFILYLTTLIYSEVYNYLLNLNHHGKVQIGDGESRTMEQWLLRNKIDDADKNGVHVVVGQFMGKGFPWAKQTNLTDDLLNSNNYSPIPKYGDNGSPVYVPKMELSKSKLLFTINQFNIMASDMISVNRSLPDVRKKVCRSKHYADRQLPDTSIIIVFHNEAWSTLVRTVHSVILRSPNQLIHEIILVDDASKRKFLQQDLDDYMAKLSSETRIKIQIVRSPQRIGLIKARILGANLATGQVLTFLDAHCECTVGWLEPLLYRISVDGQAVVCPVIDIINDQNLAYIKSFEAHWGAMNWALNFRWFSVDRDQLRMMHRKNYDHTSTFRTPIMAGGLFSIRKDFFHKMGTYDSHLEVWGGENIEMSLRIWLCGGKVEIAPCSHVGHIFRGSSPYSFGKKQVGDVLFSNLIRVAEVWLDEWKDFFYKLNPTAKRLLDHGRDDILANIQERIDLRHQLKCHSFEWFLANVWPENFFPTKNNTFGQIQSLYSRDCIQRPSNGIHPTGKVTLTQCALEIYGPQSFVMPLHEQIGYIKSDESVCLDVSSLRIPNTPVILNACGQIERQKWKYEQKTSRIVHIKTGLCLSIDRRKTFLSLAKCSRTNKRQTWKIKQQKWNNQY